MRAIGYWLLAQDAPVASCADPAADINSKRCLFLPPRPVYIISFRLGECVSGTRRVKKLFVKSFNSILT